jgi:TAG lipase/lysophosphatidylethanolamine acyltransferase
MPFGMAGVLKAIWGMLVDVLLFWQIRFSRWLTRKKPVEVWFEILRNAKSYEEWEEAAFQLDVLLGNDLWYVEMYWEEFGETYLTY